MAHGIECIVKSSGNYTRVSEFRGFDSRSSCYNIKKGTTDLQQCTMPNIRPTLISYNQQLGYPFGYIWKPNGGALPHTVYRFPPPPLFSLFRCPSLDSDICESRNENVRHRYLVCKYLFSVVGYSRVSSSFRSHIVAHI